MNWILCTGLQGTQHALPEDMIAEVYTVNAQGEGGREEQTVVKLRAGYMVSGAANLFVTETFSTIVAQTKERHWDQLTLAITTGLGALAEALEAKTD